MDISAAGICGKVILTDYRIIFPFTGKVGIVLICAYEQMYFGPAILKLRVLRPNLIFLDLATGVEYMIADR